MNVSAGVDDIDSYEELHRFVKLLRDEAGCDKFIIHARKALLDGLSPKENRTVPPLQYDYVYRLKNDFPELFIELNGGVATTEDVKYHLKRGKRRFWQTSKTTTTKENWHLFISDPYLLPLCCNKVLIQ